MALRTTTRASTIPTLALDDDTVLVIRGVGPIGYPGAAEVVNMRAPDYLLETRCLENCLASATGASRARPAARRF